MTPHQLTALAAKEHQKLTGLTKPIRFDADTPRELIVATVEERVRQRTDEAFHVLLIRNLDDGVCVVAISEKAVRRCPSLL
jgi:hypothetical protein